eukprot:XP_008763657.1 PREDICTED: uncharacterized protein LOC103690058 [Rattus norvegicus]
MKRLHWRRLLRGLLGLENVARHLHFNLFFSVSLFIRCWLLYWLVLSQRKEPPLGKCLHETQLGTLFNLLVILISKPKVPKPCSVSDAQLVADPTSAEDAASSDGHLQKLILEYTDTATALLYEILLVFQQGNLGLGSTKFAISWMMSFLQSCPSIMAFVAGIPNADTVATNSKATVSDVPGKILQEYQEEGGCGCGMVRILRQGTKKRQSITNMEMYEQSTLMSRPPMPTPDELPHSHA